jgi:acyl-CoA thioester hydrolase
MKSDFKFWEEIVVRWSDMDSLGHVNNAKYFTYCESARIGYFTRINMLGLRKNQFEGPALVSATLNFRQQVRYPDVLEVGARVSQIRTRSFSVELEIYRKGTDELVADGNCILAWVDYQVGKSVAVPEALRQAISEFEGREL